jgi:hypothetical protein
MPTTIYDGTPLNTTTTNATPNSTATSSTGWWDAVTAGTQGAWIDVPGSLLSNSSHPYWQMPVVGSGYLTSFAVRPSSENFLNGSITVYIPAQTAPSFLLAPMLRYQSASAFYGVQMDEVDGGILQFYAAGGGSIPETADFTYNSSHAYELQFSVTGTAPTTLNATLTDTTTSTIVATITATDSTTILQNPGQAGICVWGGSSGDMLIDRIATVNSSSSSLIAEAITVGAIVSSSTTLTGNATGGTPPYTYQWLESTTNDGTFTNISTANGPVTGATSQIAVIGSRTDGTPRYVYCQVTDAASHVVNSYGYTTSAVWTGSPILPYAVVPTPKEFNVVLIGDSTWTTGFNFAQSTLQTLLDNQYLPGAVGSIINGAFSGSTSTSWLPGGTPYIDLIAMLTGGTVYQFCISLGVNDAQAPTPVATNTWRSNILTTANALIAAYPGSTVYLFGTGYIAQPTSSGLFNDLSAPATLNYNLQIPSMANGTTIRVGDVTNRYFTFAQNQALFEDGVHETSTGGTIMAEIVAKGLLGAGTGGGGSGAGNLTGPQALAALGALAHTVQGPFLNSSATGLSVKGGTELVIPLNSVNNALGTNLVNSADSQNVYLGLNPGDPSNGFG